jgi:ribose transport system ATP-binding protein
MRDSTHPPAQQTRSRDQPAVSFAGIEKSFFGVKVLKSVSFDAGRGRIVGLVGENGAGKSTLMNLLGGNLQPDAGELRVNGQRYAPHRPSDARAAGVAFVHQELNLFPNLSIAENLFLTNFPRVAGRTPAAGSVGMAAPGMKSPGRLRWAGLPWIDRRALRSQATELLHLVGLAHSPDTLVEPLPAGERQLVEIAKALGAEARVLILDEPTTSLSTPECERLFAVMSKLRDQGIAIIYISHALGDVLRICDDLVVLRDGEVVGSGAAEAFTQDRVVSLMVGRQLSQLYPERRPPPRLEREDRANASGRPPALQVKSVSKPGIVRDISFNLEAGEVLGIAGLMGAGRSELARILFDHINAHTAERLSVSAAARMVGMSAPQFMKLFKQVAGMTLVAYLNHARLANAARLLRETTRSIAEIASDTGFSDQSYFDKRFKRAFGRTPKEFRAGSTQSILSKKSGGLS